MMDITVLKRNLNGKVTWQYEGRLLKREANLVLLEAFFNRDDVAFMDVVLKRDDRFVETFFTDRWYNVFEIYDRDDGKLKGWYCNVGYPAVLEKGTVSYIDLALDLWVASDGTQTVLRSVNNAFDGLSRLWRKLGASGQQTEFQYDEKGQLVIIDDGSVDATCEVAAELAYEYPQVSAVRHGEIRGESSLYVFSSEFLHRL